MRNMKQIDLSAGNIVFATTHYVVWWLCVSAVNKVVGRLFYKLLLTSMAWELLVLCSFVYFVAAPVLKRAGAIIKMPYLASKGK